jgi:hypothetical protein
MYDRDVLLKDLHAEVIEVTFTKVNGETRVMRCTLKPDMLPPNSNVAHIDEEHKKPENLSVIVAWDTQANGWRSFRVDSVKYVQVCPGA